LTDIASPALSAYFSTPIDFIVSFCRTQLEFTSALSYEFTIIQLVQLSDFYQLAPRPHGAPAFP